MNNLEQLLAQAKEATTFNPSELQRRIETAEKGVPITERMSGFNLNSVLDQFQSYLERGFKFIPNSDTYSQPGGFSVVVLNRPAEAIAADIAAVAPKVELDYRGELESSKAIYAERIADAELKFEEESSRRKLAEKLATRRESLKAQALKDLAT